MITFDGERSKGRKWFAEKQLRVAKDLDIPGKTVQWEGFTFRVWQDGELSGGRVTAPMGIAVMRVNSQPKAADFMIAESWQAGFALLSSYQVAIWDGTGYAVFNRPEDTTGYMTVPYRLMAVSSPAGVGNVAFYTDRYPVPSLFPLGEAIYATVSGHCFIDLNDNGAADMPKNLIDTNIILYSENGGRLTGRVGISHNVTDDLNYPLQTVFNLFSDRVRQAKAHINQFDIVSGHFTAFAIFDVSPSAASISFVPCPTLWYGVPTGLTDEISNVLVSEQAVASGHYAFAHDGQDVLLMGTQLTDRFGWPSSIANTYPDWRCFYSFRAGATNHVINSSQFVSLLESKSGASLSGSWDIVTVFRQFFGWPNRNDDNPPDSAMFHGHDGNIYSWTRHYGSVQFSATGMFDGGVSIPSDCTTEGVRPEITHAGDGVYLCVCNRVGSHITGVFVGSPFGTWTRLADPSTAFELLAVRPVSATYDTETETYSVILIGVARRTGTEEQPEAHFACIYRDGWLMLGQLPQHMERNEEDVLEPVAYDGWEQYDICFFGDGPVPAGLMQYPSRPPALPQMPMSTNYSDYAVGLP